MFVDLEPVNVGGGADEADDCSLLYDDEKNEDEGGCRRSLSTIDPQDEFRQGEEDAGLASQAYRLALKIAKPIKKRLSGVPSVDLDADLVLSQSDETSVAIW